MSPVIGMTDQGAAPVRGPSIVTPRAGLIHAARAALALSGQGRHNGLMLDPNPPRLAAGRVSFLAILGHAIANITPSAMATVTISLVAAQGGVLTWAVYLTVGLVMLLVAAQVAALARLAPSAGSLFVSVSRALHPLAGVLSGWAMMGGYFGALLAAPIIGGLFVTKALGVLGLPFPWLGTALPFALLAWGLTVRDVGVATRYSLYVEAVSLVFIVVIGLYVLGHAVTLTVPRPSTPFAWGPFFQAMTLSVLAYGGFETAANLGREARSPADVPRAIGAAVLVSLVFYVFMAYAELAGFHGHARRLGETAAPLSALAVKNGLPVLALLSDMAMAIAAFSATVATLNSLGRLLYSMGRHRVLPAALGQVGRHRTPSVALHTLGGLTALFAVLAAAAGWRPLAIVDLFGVFTAQGFLLIYLLAMAAIPVLRKRQGGPAPWGAYAALAAAGPILLYVFAQNFWGASGLALIAAYTFLGYLLLGALLYARWQRRSGSIPSALLFVRDDD